MQMLMIGGALFGLSMVTGMLGIGVAFAAVPLLSLFMSDLVNEVHPLSLVLNGVTALFSLFGFAHAGLVNWKRAAMLAAVTTLGAPMGATLAREVPAIYLWIAYFAAVGYLLHHLFGKPLQDGVVEKFTLGLWLAFPIALLTGFIGVGPGFMLVPVLAQCGVRFKEAAALNSFAVVPSSFAAAWIHFGHAHFEANFTLVLVGAGAAGALIGSVLASRRIPVALLRRILGITILMVTLYKLAQLLRETAL